MTAVAKTQTPVTAPALRRLAVAWTAFEGHLDQTPLMRRLTRGQFTVQDYRALLLNLRQQVVDGACWIARASSSIDEAHFELRSTLIRHAATEHRDYKLIEQDYVAAGGRLEDIRGGRKNIGSEALSAFMFHEAGKPNPFGLLGAMFIIEGLGSIKAAGWAKQIQRQLGLPDEAVRFLAYHGANDEHHMEEFAEMLAMVLPDAEVEDRIVRTAEIVGRLYALQIEEVR
jgi:heme oxygenase